MHRLFSLPRFHDEERTPARPIYAAAWIGLLAALLAGPLVASLQPERFGLWLLVAAAVALVSLVTIVVILHGSLRRALLRERDLQSLGRMAHDFNNLLTIVIGYSDALLAQLPPGDPMQDDLEAIREAGERAAGMIGPRATVSAKPPANAELALAGRAVLIVDDELAIRKLIRQALAPHGCVILEAGGGEEALAAASVHEGKIDIAIVDFVLPGLNGLDLALQLERDSPGLKTLYASSAVDSVGMASLLRHAPERVLVKPFTADQVVERVLALARGRA